MNPNARTAAVLLLWAAIPVPRPGTRLPAPGTRHPAPDTRLTADAAATFLDLQGTGGYVLLVGDAGRLANALADQLRTAIVCVNPPSRSASGAPVTVLHSPSALPIRRHSVRAAILGADAAADPWLAAAAAALLPGLRMIVEDEAAQPPGIVDLARGAGVVVGEKRGA